MCGGAIISDFIGVKRGRNLPKQQLWSELDPYSDLLGFDYSSATNAATAAATSKLPLPVIPDKKGWFLLPSLDQVQFFTPTHLPVYLFLIVLGCSMCLFYFPMYFSVWNSVIQSIMLFATVWVDIIQNKLPFLSIYFKSKNAFFS